MRIFKTYSAIIAITLLALSLPACKAKKAVSKPEPAPVEAQPVTATPATPAAAPVPVKREETVATVEKPDFNFSNIQFEFDSPILKTNSYPTLDHIVAEMKMAPSVKFILNGYSSAEGTDAHNVTLSEERANSVKSYLVNSGVDVNNLSVKGNGENNPVADNTTEQGRVTNRRVEVKVVQ